jgi:hypothetical protein
MFERIKQHRRLFICLFIIPVLFWSVLGFGLFELIYLTPRYEPRYDGMPAQLISGYGTSEIVVGLTISIILGSLSGLISASATALLFSVFPTWVHLRISRYSALYAICWLIPFCCMVFFGLALAYGISDGNVNIICSLAAFIIVSTIGGVAGILAFLLATQLPWFRGRY